MASDPETASAQSTDTNVVSEPDKAAYDKSLADLQASLKEIEEKLANVQQKIDAQESSSSKVGTAKKDVLSKLQTCRAKKAELYASTSATRLQLAALDKERMEIRRNIQSSRRNTQYTDLKALNKAVSDLKKAGKTAEAESVASQRDQIVKLEAAIAAEEKNMKESEALRKQVDKQTKESQKLRKEESRYVDKVTDMTKKEVSKELSALLKQRKDLLSSKKRTTNSISTLTKDFEKQSKAYKKYQRKLQRQAKKSATKAAAPKEAEKAKPVVKRDVWASHKKAVVRLIAYLNRLAPQGEQKEVQETGRSANVRTEKNTNFVGNAVQKFKKEEEGQWIGSMGKQKKKRRRNRKNLRKQQLVTHPRLETQLFQKVGIASPLSIGADDVSITIKKLEEKLAYYETNPDPKAADSKAVEPAPKVKVEKTASPTVSLSAFPLLNAEAESLEAPTPQAASTAKGVWNHEEAVKEPVPSNA